jgi:selenide,water dikinase
MLKAQASACTDITGFGLLGHALEMARGSRVCLRIDSSSVPIDDLALTLVKKGIHPKGAERNLAFIEESLKKPIVVDESMMRVLADPQTSGGLLISVPAAQAKALLLSLQESGCHLATDIGVVLEGPQGGLKVV